MSFGKIGVVGMGYIGLPTAAVLAATNREVVGIDINENVVETINRGDIHIVEPGLARLVSEAVRQGYLRATTSPEICDAYIIAVPTPYHPNDHSADLRYVDAACASLAPLLKAGDLVVLESTSPPGTTARIAQAFAKMRPDLIFPTSSTAPQVHIAYCPERILPGKALEELVANDRVIGGYTRTCSERAYELYKLFVNGDCIIASNPHTAEMAKLAENSYRDVNIAFANELSLICDQLDIDVWELIQLMNRHPRVNVLQPGPGVGGHCIAVDPWFIVSAAPETARLIATARAVNDSKPLWVLEKIDEAISSYVTNNNITDVGDVSIAIYGLTFKPNIDDLRDSPALEIARTLSKKHRGPIKVLEPNISALPSGLENAHLVNCSECPAAAVHVLLVDHAQFKNMVPTSEYVVDTRGLWRN